MSGREKGERGKSAENAKNSAENKDKLSNVNEVGEMFLQWPLLSSEKLNTLLEVSVDQVQIEFENLLGLKKHQTCAKEAALLDYYVAGFWWAKEMNFTCQQISFIMALLQLLIDNIQVKHMQFVDGFKEFTQAVLATRKSSSADVEALFGSDQIKSITDYFKNSLFQHYRLYEFLFTRSRDDVLLAMEKSIEVVNSADFAAPLEEGLPSELYFRYIAPHPPTLPDQGQDKSLQKNDSESGECEQAEALERIEDFSVEAVQEVLGEMATEMLAALQAEFTEKLRIQEDIYTARLESLKKGASK